MKLRRIGVVLAAVGLLATGCATDGDNGDTDDTPASFVDEIKEKNELVVGVKFDVPQFGYRGPTNEEPEGFDVDIAKEVAKELGVKPKFVEAISKNRIPLLTGNKVDIVFSTMTITDERKEQIDFSDVYYVAEQSFLTKKGESMSVDTAGGKKVCTSKGSTSELNLPAVQPDVVMELQDGYAQCVQLLRNDQVDAVSTDDVILLQFLKQDPDLFEVSEETFSTEPYGAGIKKGHDDFVELVNDVIAEIKTDGTWAKLYKKWIAPVTGEEPPEPPTNDVEFEIEGLETPVPAPPASPTGSPAASPTATP
jgi:aspartate/glutamate/glutamine transport system substrate-binding protein